MPLDIEHFRWQMLFILCTPYMYLKAMKHIDIIGGVEGASM